MNTPDNITELLPNQIFVFGSNEAGRHLGWAARIAHELFDANWWVGEWLEGNTYAFPTLDWDFRKRTISELRDSVEKFIEVCNNNPDKEFLLTKVWCGIAGFTEEEMKTLFANTSNNVVKPTGW